MICVACEEREAVYHVTLNLSIFGPKSERQKLVQFCLCEACDVRLGQVMLADDQRKARLAARLTAAPEFMSETPAWRHKSRGYAALDAA